MIKQAECVSVEGKFFANSEVVELVECFASHICYVAPLHVGFLQAGNPSQRQKTEVHMFICWQERVPKNGKFHEICLMARGVGGCY